MMIPAISTSNPVPEQCGWPVQNLMGFEKKIAKPQAKPQILKNDD
jgi:hypothetical protein